MGSRANISKDINVTSQTIVITGANRGIGLQFVKNYLNLGAHVIAGCRSPENAPELQALRKELGDHLKILPLDVKVQASVSAFARAIGERPVDLLINNAGIKGAVKQSSFEMDYESWMEVMDINAMGPLRVFQALETNLKTGQDTKIITISSQMGAMSFPGASNIAYRSSKSAVNKVMCCLAEDLAGDNITVAMLHPGWVKTDMGGDAAEVTVADSTAGMMKVIDALTFGDTGSFYKWNGEQHDW
jgi:NAD(P)-dependent dehydrogenase (short-subunit alcohol dehydrogenase family)